MVADLSPQGPDAAKALLDFHQPGFIKTKENLAYFKDFGFSLYGMKNISMENFFKKHHADMVLSAEEPFEHRFWSFASKPWQFLKFCSYYAEWSKHGSQAPIHMPISRDASCSGLQHFASLLKDEKGANLVNVTPNKEKQDIYGVIADQLNMLLQSDIENQSKDIDFAKGWKSFGLDRNFTKDPVMTIPYGKTSFGHLVTIKNWLKNYRHEHSQPIPWPVEMDKKAAHYMYKILEKALANHISFAKTVMDWLRECADLMSKENITPLWKTPLGFVVNHKYDKKNNSKRIVTRLGSQSFTLKYADGFNKKERDINRQKNGISPNVIHSLDAAHMQDTVLKAYKRRIPNLCMQHDSFGTTVDQIGNLNDTLRSSFIELYQKDILQDLYDQFSQQIKFHKADIELPKPPNQGCLNIEKVQKSTFFFS